MEENRETVGCYTKMFYSCSTMILINWISVNFHSLANLLWECLTVSAVFVIVIFPIVRSMGFGRVLFQ